MCIIFKNDGRRGIGFGRRSKKEKKMMAGRESASTDVAETMPNPNGRGNEGGKR